MKVAMIGAGIYGSTIALALAEEGFAVDLIEREDDIMKVSTPISLRAHSGYFYPRSIATMRSCRDTMEKFQRLYPMAIVDGMTHYYLIAQDGSKISGAEYVEVLDANGLLYEKLTEPLVNPEKIALSIKVPEYSYDPDILREAVRAKLAESSVHLVLSTNAAETDLSGYDLKIIAAYAANNDVARSITGAAAHACEYRFNEKVVVTLPAAFERKNFVVLDGPFFQIDPLGRDGSRFVLSHFKHSVHARHEGDSFDIEPEMRALLGRGVVENPPITNAPYIIEAIAEFIPEIRKAEILGSLFAVKPLLLNNAEDARPVSVRAIRPDVLAVLAGKVSGSVSAAEECVRYARALATSATTPPQEP
jgi:hypothetical protein